MNIESINLSELSNDQLDKLVVMLCTDERKATVKLLYHLKEFDSRKAYLEIGYSSMFDYCTRKLKFSEGGAYRRITAARALADNPEIAQLLVSGKLSLSSITIASKSLKTNKTTIQEITDKSKREVEKVVSKDTPVTKPKEVIKPLSVIQPKIADALPLEAAKPQEDRYYLKFTVTEDVYNRLNEAKGRLSNTLGADLSLEALLEKLLDCYLDKTVKHRSSTSSTGDSRYIPPIVKDTVFKRDEGQCTYVAPDGTRCCQRCYLHIDHIDPYALGGKSTVENLRLLCSAHNQYESRLAFG